MALVLKIIEHILYGYTNVLSKYSNIWNNLWFKCQNMKYKYQWISKYISTHKQINTNANSKSAMHINIYLRSKYNATYNDWFLDIKMSGSILCTLVKWSSDLWIKEIDGKKYFRQEMNLRRRSESIKNFNIHWINLQFGGLKREWVNPNFLLTTLFKYTYFWQKEADLFFPVHLGFDSSTKNGQHEVYLGQTIIQTVWNYCHLVLYKVYIVFHYYRSLVNRNVTL